MIPSYFYDSEMNQCRQFIFGGCGGNANRFGTVEECESKCRPTSQMTRSAGPAMIPSPVPMATASKSRKNPDCLLERETGPCRGSFKVYGFDANQQDCVTFTYGGCNGNANRFPSREECMAQCSGLIANDNTNMMRLQQLTAQAPTLIFQQERGAGRFI
ncbi:putative Tissue factor pathway inhibitor [Hypsibius exemplaris]|uniref:Tissue factor pathway inhibitor n=1 Tax=Hypsibius exemplaris TaxID=2072580 RepID=A0A9X6RL60_HYPEX|nr:putative Tissue factor pathway inhibitor [Hypsibius exemplaris]